MLVHFFCLFCIDAQLKNMIAQLKLDNHTDVGSWHWSTIAIPPLITAFLFLVVWTIVHYHQAGDDDQPAHRQASPVIAVVPDVRHRVLAAEGSAHRPGAARGPRLAVREHQRA